MRRKLILLLVTTVYGSAKITKEDKLERKRRQRWGYQPRFQQQQDYNYNYDYPRFENRRPYHRNNSNRRFGSNNNAPQSKFGPPKFQPSSRNYGFDYPSYPSYGMGRFQPKQPVQPQPYARMPSINNGFYQQNGEYSFRVKTNPFTEERVPLVKPGHLARQGGRNVRPPGVLDERVLNPRTKNMNGNLGIIEPSYGPYPTVANEYPISEYAGYPDYLTPHNSSDLEDYSGQESFDEIDVLVSEGDEPRPSHPDNPDVVGLPDLLTDPLRVQQTLNVDFQFLHNLTCALEEGCLAPSAYNIKSSDPSNLRKLLRFTQKISNIGDADFLSPHNPNDWQYHQCHKHYHSMNVFSSYELLSITNAGEATVSSSHKASFCLEDTECLPGRTKKYDCKTEQAISPGCSDIYVSGIDCQWIDVTDVPLGHYILQVKVNPSHLVKERSFENNVLTCDVYLSRKQAWAKNCRN